MNATGNESAPHRDDLSPIWKWLLAGGGVCLVLIGASLVLWQRSGAVQLDAVHNLEKVLHCAVNYELTSKFFRLSQVGPDSSLFHCWHRVELLVIPKNSDYAAIERAFTPIQPPRHIYIMFDLENRDSVREFERVKRDWESRYPGVEVLGGDGRENFKFSTP